MRFNADWRGRLHSGASPGSQIEGRIFNNSGEPFSPAGASGAKGYLYYDTAGTTCTAGLTSNGRLRFSDGNAWTPLVTSVTVHNTTANCGAGPAKQANETVNGLGFVSSSNCYDTKLTMLLADASNAGALTAAHYSLLAGATSNATVNTLVYRGNDGGRSFFNVDDLISTDPGTRVVNKNYVDAVAQGLSVHGACRVKAPSNVTVASPGATIDGVTMASGDRVLMDAQTTTSEDGIWVWNGAAVPMTRAPDMPAGFHAAASFTFIEEGTSDNKGFVCTNNKPNDVAGTDNLTFAQFSSAGSYTAGNGLTLNGTVFHFAQSSNYTTNTIPYASGTTTIGFISTGTSGQPLRYGSPPSWGALDISSANNVTGLLRLQNGGTNRDNSGGATGGIAYKDATSITLTAALTGVLHGNGASAPTAVTGTQYGVPFWTTTSQLGTTLAPANNNVYLRGNTTGAPTWSGISATGITGILPIENGGTGNDTFTQGSVIFMGATRFEEDNPNFFWDDTNNELGLRTNNPTEALTFGGGGWRINNGGALSVDAELFGAWMAAYGGTWNRGIGWLGSSGTLGGIMGATGTNDVFSNFYFGPTAATAWVKITNAGQLQVLTTGSAAGVLWGNGATTAKIYCAVDKVLQAQQLTVDISTTATAAFRADSTNVSGQVAFAHFNQAADANALFRIRRNTTVDTILEWGAGGATAVDTNLYRSAANVLKTDDSWVVGGTYFQMTSAPAGSGNFVATWSTSGTNAQLQLRTISSAVWGTLPNGSGTLNRLAKWTPNGSTLGDSNVTDNGTDITLTPASGGEVILALSGTSELQLTGTGTGRGISFGVSGAGRALSTDINVSMWVTTDTVNRFQIDAGGVHSWGAGGASAVDTTLYRSAANTLKTDDSFIVGGTNLQMTTVPSASTDTVAIWSATSNGNLSYRTIDTRVWGSTLVGGTGSANVIAKWSNTNTLTTSGISDDATNITLDPVGANGDVRLTFVGTGALSFGASGAGRAASTDLNVRMWVATDTVNRFQIDAGGVHSWGPGGSTAVDTNLYRSAANILRTDDTFVAARLNIAGTGSFNTSASTVIETVGYISPSADNTYDLGEASFRWRNIRGVNLIVSTGLTLPSFTQGSVIFSGIGGLLSQNNTHFSWDDAQHTLSIAASKATSGIAIELTPAARGSIGITNSHSIYMRARTYDTTAHNGAWGIQAVGLTNAGSSEIQFTSGLDATPAGIGFAVRHVSNTAVNYLVASGTATTVKYAQLEAAGTDAAVGIVFKPKGTPFTTSGNNHSVHNVDGRLIWNDGAAAKPNCSLTRMVVVNLNGVDVDRSNAVPSIGTSITVNHMLKNANAWCFLVNTATNAVEIADITQTTADAVVLGFSNSPASGDYRVVIIG